MSVPRNPSKINDRIRRTQSPHPPGSLYHACLPTRFHPPLGGSRVIERGGSIDLETNHSRKVQQKPSPRLGSTSPGGRGRGSRSERQVVSDPSPKRRSGATLLIVVITLIVITTLIGAMLQHLLVANRQAKQRAHKAQAVCLAESAIERAVFALRHDENYRAEVWKISAAELGGRNAGRVEIDVAAGQADSTAVVSVTASYPDASDFRATVRKQITVSKRKINKAAEE